MQALEAGLRAQKVFYTYAEDFPASWRPFLNSEKSMPIRRVDKAALTMAQHFSAGFAEAKRTKSRKGRQECFFRPLRIFGPLRICAGLECTNPSDESLGYFHEDFRVSGSVGERPDGHGDICLRGRMVRPFSACRCRKQGRDRVQDSTAIRKISCWIAPLCLNESTEQEAEREVERRCRDGVTSHACILGENNF